MRCKFFTILAIAALFADSARKVQAVLLINSSDDVYNTYNFQS